MYKIKTLRGVYRKGRLTPASARFYFYNSLSLSPVWSQAVALQALFLSRHDFIFHLGVYSSDWKSIKSSWKINLALMFSYLRLPGWRWNHAGGSFDLTNGHWAGSLWSSNRPLEGLSFKQIKADMVGGWHQKDLALPSCLGLPQPVR